MAIKYLKLALLAILLTIVVSTATEKSDVQEETSAEGMRKEGEKGSESWTTWAKDKISGGLSFKGKPDEEEAPGKAGEGVKNAREKAQEMVSDVGGYAAGKAGDVKEGAYSTGEAVKEKIASSYGAAKEKVAGGSHAREEEL